MGFFDLFEEANEQFCKDVGKAWDELRSSDSSDDDADDNDSDSHVGLENILPRRPWTPGPKSPLPDPIDILEKNGRKVEIDNPIQKIFRTCSKPAPGTPVYCNLAIVVEHTGIYIGDDEIVHLNGDGNIEIVSPQEFVARLDGDNPGKAIYYAAKSNGTPLCRTSIANRARSKVGDRRNYNVVFDNCHQFTCGCISGDFENPCKLFSLVEMEINLKLGPLTWVKWDY